MDSAKRQALGKILDQAMLDLGQERIVEISDFYPPIFYRQSAQRFHSENIAKLKHSLAKFKSDIESALK